MSYKRDAKTEKVLAVKMAEKSKVFTKKDSEIYYGDKPEGIDEHH